MVVWYDTMQLGMVWYGMVYDMVWVWVWYCMAYIVWCDVVWYSLAWYNIVSYYIFYCLDCITRLFTLPYTGRCWQSW